MLHVHHPFRLLHTHIREPTRIYSGHVSAGLGAESGMPTTMYLGTCTYLTLGTWNCSLVPP